MKNGDWLIYKLQMQEIMQNFKLGMFANRKKFEQDIYQVVRETWQKGLKEGFNLCWRNYVENSALKQAEDIVREKEF